MSKTPQTTPDKLAIHGGKPVTRQAQPAAVRWDDAERDQLGKMIGQPSLFYWNGPQTKLLSERFRQYYPLRYVMACSSGTAAIHIAMAAAGIGPGDEVITSPITDMGSVIGILYQQGVPVFADLHPHRYTLDLNDVRKRITPRTRAILAVHLAGAPCNLHGLKELADEHALILIEDCAQAWGAVYRGRPVGTVGHIGCYSLNDFKHIGCGDGGIVASNDSRFGPLLQGYGDKAYDRTSPFPMPEVLAPNYRISEPQSAVAAVQMTRMWDITERRSKAGWRLTRRITGIPGIHPHETDAEDRCTFWFYLLRLDLGVLTCSREEFANALKAEGIPCDAGYISRPIYQYPLFQNHNFFAGRWPIREQGLTAMDYGKIHCPQAEAILKDCIRIPINQAMNESWIDNVASAVRKVAEAYAA